jgi:hypothetical protein
LIPQLNKFPRDQKFVLGDRIEYYIPGCPKQCRARIVFYRWRDCALF